MGVYCSLLIYASDDGANGTTWKPNTCILPKQFKLQIVTMGWKG